MRPSALLRLSSCTHGSLLPPNRARLFFLFHDYAALKEAILNNALPPQILNKIGVPDGLSALQALKCIRENVQRQGPVYNRFNLCEPESFCIHVVAIGAFRMRFY